MRVAFVTLGCPKNEVDSDRMLNAIAASGHVGAELDDADVAVINTCAFIRDAVEESIAEILELAEWKTLRAGRRLVVTGCLPSRYAEDLAGELPEVDVFVPVADERSLASVLDGFASAAGAPMSAPAGEPTACRSLGSPSAYLLVCDGCFRECAFCTIPSIRGPFRSRPLDELVAEAAALAAGGTREIVLVGQDVSAYGRDLPAGEDLPALLRALGGVKGLDWIRIMYVQPDGVTDELLTAIAETPQVCRYLDLPLQHASERVLRAMRRPGDAEAFLALIARIRAALPGVVLRTTLIAGFPGETEEDVEVLERFLVDAALDYAGVFPFSPEEGTPAAEMKGRPAPRVRLARTQRLRDIADAIGFEKAAEHVGETIDVLVEGVEDGETVGRWRGQAPEVDGVVSLDAAVPAGSIVTAKVVDALGYDLVGEVVEWPSR